MLILINITKRDNYVHTLQNVIDYQIDVKIHLVCITNKQWQFVILENILDSSANNWKWGFNENLKLKV